MTSPANTPLFVSSLSGLDWGWDIPRHIAQMTCGAAHQDPIGHPDAIWEKDKFVAHCDFLQTQHHGLVQWSSDADQTFNGDGLKKIRRKIIKPLIRLDMPDQLMHFLNQLKSVVQPHSKFNWNEMSAYCLSTAIAHNCEKSFQALWTDFAASNSQAKAIPVGYKAWSTTGVCLMYRRLNMLSWLAENDGFNPDATNSHGDPLVFALFGSPPSANKASFSELTNFIVKHGVDLNSQQSPYHSVLEMAIYQERKDLLWALLEAGADLKMLASSQKKRPPSPEMKAVLDAWEIQKAIRDEIGSNHLDLTRQPGKRM